ncbi:MAG: hypothetical protein ACRDQ5_20245 [Sciscionella sp.]
MNDVPGFINMVLLVFGVVVLPLCAIGTLLHELKVPTPTTAIYT